MRDGGAIGEAGRSDLGAEAEIDRGLRQGCVTHLSMIVLLPTPSRHSLDNLRPLASAGANI